MKIKIAAAVVVLIILGVIISHGLYLPISGTVIDGETKQPIEGAVILVEWTKKVGIGDYHTESVKVVETMSDKEGKFKVSGLFNFAVDKPDVAVYKKGYVAWNNKFIFPSWEKRTGFRWQSGRSYLLEKFKSTYSYIDHSMFVAGAISDTISPEKKRSFMIMYDAGEGREIFRERQERDEKRKRRTVR